MRISIVRQKLIVYSGVFELSKNQPLILDKFSVHNDSNYYTLHAYLVIFNRGFLFYIKWNNTIRYRRNNRFNRFNRYTSSDSEYV